MQIDRYQLKAAQDRFAARATERQRNLIKIAQGDLLGIDEPRRVQMFLTRRGFSPAEARALADSGRPVAAAIETAAGTPEPFALERVIGTSDLMGVAFLERGLQVARTVGRILIDATGGQPRGYGSGFLVSPRLLLTNHHVLGDPAVAARSLLELDYQLGVDGQPRPTALFTLDPGDLHLVSRELDYALVAVRAEARDGRTLRSFGWNALLAEEGKAIAGQWLNIIQHPDGGLKQLALRENQLVDVLEQFLHYQTDTAPGSSGSPVLNDRWEVVALHHAGVVARDAQGRILAIDGSLWTPEMGEDRIRWIANEGARISRVLASLRAQMPTGAAGALLEEMLAASPPAVPAAPPTPTPQPASGRPELALAEDGTATWTIPLTVSVRLGLPAAPAATIPAALAVPPPAVPSPAVAVATTPVPDADSGPEAVLAQARRELGQRPDVAEVRLGYLFRDGWITRERAIVVTVPRRLSEHELATLGRSPLPERLGGLPVEVTEPRLRDLLAAAAGAESITSLTGAGLGGEEIVYAPPPQAPLATVRGRMRLVAHVSPDHGWPVLQDFLKATRRRLTVGMFDLGAPHIIGALTALARRRRFERLTLVLQRGSNEGSGTKADDLPDAVAVERLGQALGGRFSLAWAKLGRVHGWVASSYHIKVAVRDGTAFWLSSGNWQSSNQPAADPLAETPPSRDWLARYNREWHAVVEHEGLAETFERYLQHDFTRNHELAGGTEALPPDLLLPQEALLPCAGELAEAFRYFAPFDEERELTVTPILTPDNFHATVLDLVRGAQEQLLIQNQTFNAPRDGQDALRELVEAVLERQRAGLDVRIVFRLFRPADARANLEALQELGFAMDRIKVQANCHTKGVIVDGRHVLLGSQNWSSDGVSLNRDASLLVEDAPLAGYFREVFEHDWQSLAVQDIGREAAGTRLAAAGEATPAGMVRLSWKDIAELA